MNTLEPITEWQDKAAQDVLNILDRWSDRIGNHQMHKRRHPRSRFRSRVIATLVDQDQPVGESAERFMLTVWTRNLSQSGFSFIHNSAISADRIAICLDPVHAPKQWYYAQIMRRRKVHGDFWEYGAQFTSTNI